MLEGGPVQGERATNNCDARALAGSRAQARAPACGPRHRATMALSLQLLSLAVAISSTAALDNGAADTPPLGWCSWQRYRCAIACNDSTSKDCFNEGLIRATADAMAASPLKAAG